MKHYSDEVIRGILMERKRKAHNRRMIVMLIGAAVVGLTLGYVCENLVTLFTDWLVML